MEGGRNIDEWSLPSRGCISVLQPCRLRESAINASCPSFTPRLLPLYTPSESVVGVVKAYTTRVGGGPFPTELTDARGGGDIALNAPGTDVGLHLQNVGGEVGVT